MIEMLVAIVLVGVVTTFAVLTFNAVTTAWTSSTEYLDKMQRSDYMLDQVVSGLKSMYYPHTGQQDYTYGFYLTDGGKVHCYNIHFVGSAKAYMHDFRLYGSLTWRSRVKILTQEWLLHSLREFAHGDSPASKAVHTVGKGVKTILRLK